MNEKQEEAPEKVVVRSVRYDSTLYAWLKARAQRFKRSVQSENTFLLDQLRRHPHLLIMLESAAANTTNGDEAKG